LDDKAGLGPFTMFATDTIYKTKRPPWSAPQAWTAYPIDLAKGFMTPIGICPKCWEDEGDDISVGATCPELIPAAKRLKEKTLHCQLTASNDYREKFISGRKIRLPAMATSCLSRASIFARPGNAGKPRSGCEKSQDLPKRSGCRRHAGSGVSKPKSHADNSKPF
jgi:hypothetical protein